MRVIASSHPPKNSPHGICEPFNYSILKTEFLFGARGIKRRFFKKTLEFLINYFDKQPLCIIKTASLTV